MSDDPSKVKPSDHFIPLIEPNTANNNIKSKRNFIKRPMPESRLKEFVCYIASENWNAILEGQRRQH